MPSDAVACSGSSTVDNKKAQVSFHSRASYYWHIWINGSGQVQEGVGWRNILRLVEGWMSMVLVLILLLLNACWILLH